MDSQAFWDKYSPFIKQNLLVLSLVFLGLIFLGYGLIQFFHQKSDPEEIVLETAETPVKEAAIMVDVAGAVMHPGVYKVSADGRMQDALVSAGGLSDDADREWVARVINLAAKVSDGTKLYIPFKGGGDNNSLSSANSALNKQININSANQSELESLSGIGPATAEKIIANRPYSVIDELVKKKVLSSKVFEKIKDKINVY
ncbi:MAG: ComEA family DNA-binding protein [Candidatus Levybacteria bacterium]|nr:ComEA family DNA-binding protein [Candidatus Levybacteria bacterium]